ncbi:hypothetical protein EV144_102555 [Flavobacterium sp. 270]|uniref:hypothetical protein n=1 Tax=Flavobacterium sp. 270 TaxID=2512114 RepID=UPI001066530E|nr:hypothetical protein [Flavobacterium sp. 270]TDW50120.1 hypothetical protein EV144_102555 [Flavobacterium sp. 270]
MTQLYIPDFSYNDYLTYPIKKEDTLESVALKFGIESSQLRSYHNFRAPLEDAIRESFPSHLKLLIIEPEKVELNEEEKEQNRKNVVFNDGPRRLSLNYSHGDRTYGVISTIQSGDAINTLKEEIRVQWKAQDQGYHFFDLNRTQPIYVNDTAASTMAEDIAEKAAKSLYPLVVVVNESGKWVHINNINQIQERWLETKKQLRKNYKGSIIEKYFALYNKNLESSDTLLLALSKDWFLNAFFNGIHTEYPENLSILKEIKFPFLAKNDSLKYNVEQKLDHQLDVDNLIVLDINGELSDDRSKTDFENALNIPVKEYTEEKATGFYRAKYFLNPNSYMPEALSVSCTLAINVPQKYSITISNIKDKKEFVIASRTPTFVGIYKKPKKDYTEFWLILIIIMTVAILIGLVIFLKQL